MMPIPSPLSKPVAESNISPSRLSTRDGVYAEYLGHQIETCSTSSLEVVRVVYLSEVDQSVSSLRKAPA